jgi:hypothetical protein
VAELTYDVPANFYVWELVRPAGDSVQVLERFTVTACYGFGQPWRQLPDGSLLADTLLGATPIEPPWLIRCRIDDGDWWIYEEKLS